MGNPTGKQVRVGVGGDVDAILQEVAQVRIWTEQGEHGVLVNATLPTVTTQAGVKLVRARDVAELISVIAANGGTLADAARFMEGW